MELAGKTGWLAEAVGLLESVNDMYNSLLKISKGAWLVWLAERGSQPCACPPW